jgi:2-dehydro-3-deoxyphosphogluconate aldolase/(4S)-4-hydroxy-2-oxoglutarate aldolase
MLKQETLRKITETGVVAVVRAENFETGKKIASACIEGGINTIEITFTVPGALKVIEELASSFSSDELIIGAGTVLDSDTARLAILAGAKFIVGPSFDLETAKLCNRYLIPYMPGCLTPTEMVHAMEAGVDIVKLFPGSAFGPSYVSAIKGPLPQINIMPTGGVSLTNVNEWIHAGVVAVGIGSELTGSAKKGNYEEIVLRAKAFVSAVKEARLIK